MNTIKPAITDEAVEAAARAEWTHEWPTRPWEKVPDDLADHYRDCSRLALAAAAPFVAAKALRDAADGYQTGGWADDLPAAGGTRPALILGMSQRAVALASSPRRPDRGRTCRRDCGGRLVSRVSHRFMPEQTNGGAYFSDCSCGWSGGVYPSRGDAKRAHAAHVTGGPVPEPIRPMLLLAPEADS